MASVIGTPVALPAASDGFLAKQRIIAGPGFDRGLVPPAALATLISVATFF